MAYPKFELQFEIQRVAFLFQVKLNCLKKLNKLKRKIVLCIEIVKHIKFDEINIRFM